MKDVFKGEKGSQFLLAIVLIIYILSNVQTPQALASLVDNVVGNVAVVIVALCAFGASKPPKIVGILAIIAAYVFIKRSSVSNGSYGLRNFVPSEDSKLIDFSQFNDFPVTLEEEVVAKMAPMVRNDPASNADYKPVMDGLHDAAPINYEGVI